MSIFLEVSKLRTTDYTALRGTGAQEGAPGVAWPHSSLSPAEEPGAPPAPSFLTPRPGSQGKGAAETQPAVRTQGSDHLGGARRREVCDELLQVGSHFGLTATS